MAIQKIAKEKKPFDLIICGKQTNDGDTGHVGPGIAAWLNIPNAAYVGHLEDVKEGSITVRRMMEDGYDVLELPTPALISVVKEINEKIFNGDRTKKVSLGRSEIKKLQLILHNDINHKNT